MPKLSFENDRFNLIYLVMLSIIVCAPVLMNGFPFSYDIQNALVAFTQWSGQLYNGDLYPRWLYGLYNGYGAPMFYYYAPLPFYTESLVHAISGFMASPYLVLGLSALIMVMTSAFACYFWLRDKFSAPSALLGAAAYTILPYHIVIDLYVRGSLTELYTFTWLPLCLLFIARAVNNKGYSWLWLALSYSALLLCSIPISLAVSPFLLIYCAFEIYEAKRNEGETPSIFGLFFGLLCGFGLAAFYLITAYLMKDYIGAEKFWNGFYAPENWFLCWPCEASLMPDFMQKISWVVAIEFALALALFVTCFKSQSTHKSRALFWIIMAVGSVFMMSGASKIFWQVLPLMESIQFPWRLTIILDLALAYFAALKLPATWKSSEKELHIPLIFACVLLSYSFNNVMNVSYAASDEIKAEIETAITKGKYLDVYLPKDSDLSLEQVMGNDAPIDYTITDGGLSFELPPAEQESITLHQFYFPTWNAILKESAQELVIKNNNGKIEIPYPQNGGTVLLSHEISREEKIGLGISWLTLLVCIGGVFITRRRNQT